MENQIKETNTTVNLEKRKNIEKRVISLEKYNYNQKELGNPEMITRIKKIIEEEISK